MLRFARLVLGLALWFWSCVSFGIFRLRNVVKGGQATPLPLASRKLILIFRTVSPRAPCCLAPRAHCSALYYATDGSVYEIYISPGANAALSYVIKAATGVVSDKTDPDGDINNYDGFRHIVDSSPNQ